MIDLSRTFDTTNALSSVLLWIIFGYLGSMLNCDLQRMIHKNPFFLHAIGFSAFLLLFTIIDNSNKHNIYILLLKTFIIYILFILMTKSQWFIVVPVIFLLVIDQFIKKDIAIREAKNNDIVNYKYFQTKLTKAINIIIITLILLGCVHFIGTMKKFSIYPFFEMNSHCNKIH